MFMKAAVLSIDGSKQKEIELPEVFSTKVDEVLIRRAVLSIQSARLQPNSPYKGAGREYSAWYIGSRGQPAQYRTMNTEHSRLPRLKNRRQLTAGKVALVPHAVKGPAAHPPKVEKILKEKINRKEKKKAVESAIAATAMKELVKKRGHRPGSRELPIIVEDKLEQIDKTRKVTEMLEKLGLIDDVERAKQKRKLRAGKGKKRGRKYKKAKSVLIVIGKAGKISKAARNIEGVDVIEAKNLNAELLAPGAVPGRLTVWSESSLKELKGA